MPHVLDNPIWNALSTRQESFSVGGSLARRFDASIGPLAGVAEQSPEAYAELARLLEPGQAVALMFDEAPRIPGGWRMIREAELIHMTCPGEPVFPAGFDSEGTLELPSEGTPELTPLTAADVPAMLELVQLTEPGPFGPRTIELGGYVGIKIEDRLAAMAGFRVAPPGYREVSAVCTHPDFRGRGYAQLLVASVAREIRALGEIPFLTSYADNTRAIRVYETAGFRLRRSLNLAVITPATEES